MAREALLAQGLAALPFAVPPSLSASLLHYLDLLNQWNRVHNLTAVRDEEEQIRLHLLDCLSVLPHLPPGSLADIGSGAGLPALMIALAQPERTIFAVESHHKKSAFLRQAVLQLGLKNVQIIARRVEQWTQRVDVIISRAMANVNLFLDLTAHLGDEASVWLLMKGSQRENLQRQDFQLEALPLQVPLLAAERHILRLRRVHVDDVG